MSVLILKPNDCHISFTRAAEIFKEFYQKVTDKAIDICETDDGKSDLVVIGLDFANDFVKDADLEISRGTDDYRIRSYKQNGRNVLVLAGGRGRSTIYAVYDYFERFANCHYFWDGDVISHCESLPLTDIDIVQSPRFEYRGLRYFAHRGLKRFQAEHWSFEDWKQEIDWLVKKRLNFFMLRIGMDDIWNRAFPSEVPYPDGFNTIKGTDAEGYNDRTDFWSLRYRGELKIKVLEYAKSLDLIYPVDCGTMTHWYSRTPLEFLQKKKPQLLRQEVARYTTTDTGVVFDFTKKENMDYYMHLTETMVNEHEKTSELFHTIGLGERQIYKDKDKNFALKLTAYRKITENIQERYPNSKLMLASWDFAGWWSADEVQNLIKELDPERTVILDYTSEGNDPDCTFLNWGVVGKFPWIFGLFHAYESENELRGPYERTDARLKVAAADPQCKGMILWPELSHSDPLVLEYLCQNSWAPLEKSIEQITKDFCQKRYGALAELMNGCWQRILPLVKLGDWGGFSRRDPSDEKYIEYCPNWYSHQDLWTKPLEVIGNITRHDDELIKIYQFKATKTFPVIANVIDALKDLGKDASIFENEFILRDAVDMARTVLSRILNFIFINAVAHWENTDKLNEIQKVYFEGLDLMQRLLSVNSDFSIYDTLRYLHTVTDTNPDFEITLKRNISNAYCRQGAYELVAFLLKDEAEAAFDILRHEKNYENINVASQFNAVFEKFEKKPLKDMQPSDIPCPAQIISETADFTKRYSYFIN